MKPHKDGSLAKGEDQSFEVFFSDTSSANYKLGRLLRHENHSDIFSLQPLQVPDPNPTNFELEARRYVLDGSDGMPLEVREYHLINMEGLASRRLRTSLPENDHVAIIVYTADQPKVDPLESWRDGSMFNSSLDPEDGQKDFISFAQYQSGRGLQTTDVDLEAAPDVEERTGMTNRVAHLLRSWFTPRRVLSGFRNFLSFAVVFLLVEYLAGILFSR